MKKLSPTFHLFDGIREESCGGIGVNPVIIVGAVAVIIDGGGCCQKVAIAVDIFIN